MSQSTRHIDDAEFRQAFAPNEGRLLDQLMKQLKPGVQKFLEQMGAWPEEAEDIFIIAITVLWERSSSKGFEPGFNFYAFLLEVCKHQWYNLLKDKKKRGNRVTPENLTLLNPDPGILELLELVEWKSQLLSSLDCLGNPCSELLLSWAEGLSFEIIAQKMGYKNADTARQQNHKCMKRLKKRFGRSFNQE